MHSNGVKCIGYVSRGIGRIPHLRQFLEADVVRVGRQRCSGVTHIAGWGAKPTAESARALAKRCGLPYIGLEDGFLRSLGLGVAGARPHSLIVDFSGIYYDARRSSDLEALIHKAPFSQEELKRADHCMALLRHYRLSKYNHAPDCSPPLPPAHRRILVVDQTAGDASISCGLAGAEHFTQMLDAAVEENPHAEIVVKLHPDVVAGRKSGHLLDAAQRYNCTLITKDCSPWALLDQVDAVYVVTSQLGFEALLAGKEVHCFGMPFYAGWGLTHDRMASPRRGIPRTLAQVFAAAYLRYCRYINPYTGSRCELEETIRLLADQRRAMEEGAGTWWALGFSRWKRRFLPRFFGPAAELRFIRQLPNTAHKTPRGVVVWSSRVTEPLTAACQSRGLPLWRMEDGFIRSVGLGVDLVAPLSLVLDSRGIYYDARRASDLEVLLNAGAFPDDLLQRAARLRERLVELNLSKYNVGISERITLPAGRRVILVPGQVESDASIACGSPHIKKNRELLAAVREHHPDAWVIYKPHPDVIGGGRYGALDTKPGEKLFDQEIHDISMPALLAQVDEVHTMSSLTGFEALLRGVRVETYGLPFYAGWGLTHDHLTTGRRKRHVSLDELVAATLILYPRYADPTTGEAINPETAIDILCRQRATANKPRVRTHLYRLWRNRFAKR